MKEDNSHIDYFQLMSKYLSGNASDAEVKLLEEWVLSSPENKAQFNAFKKAWMLSGVEQNNSKIDVEDDWKAVAGQLFPEEKIVPLRPKTRRWNPLYVRVAAAAAVLLAASIWFIPYLSKDDMVELTTLDKIEEEQLPDGTDISLNQYSTVTYVQGTDQRQRQRRVELTGDAFFEVQRDTASPFMITAEEIEIEVLGTSFYVDAREDQPQIQVIVQSGIVSVTAGQQQVILEADEIGIYDKPSGTLNKRKNEDVNYMAWKTEILTFEESNLEGVVFDLNRRFHANISIANEEIKACELTATYGQNSLEAIVRIIEKTLNIEAEISREEIIFSGQSCE